MSSFSSPHSVPLDCKKCDNDGWAISKEVACNTYVYVQPSTWLQFHYSATCTKQNE